MSPAEHPAATEGRAGRRVDGGIAVLLEHQAEILEGNNALLVCSVPSWVWGLLWEATRDVCIEFASELHSSCC